MPRAGKQAVIREMLQIDGDTMALTPVEHLGMQCTRAHTCGSLTLLASRACAFCYDLNFMCCLAVQMDEETKALTPVEYLGVKCVSFGFAGQGSAIMRGPMVSGLVQQLLVTSQWGALDYLVVDFPPGTGTLFHFGCGSVTAMRRPRELCAARTYVLAFWSAFLPVWRTCAVAACDTECAALRTAHHASIVITHAAGALQATSSCRCARRCSSTPR